MWGLARTTRTTTASLTARNYRGLPSQVCPLRSSRLRPDTKASTAPGTSTWVDRYSRDGEPDDPWDFGTTTQYPALSRDLTGDDRATWQEFGYQFRSALTLDGGDDERSSRGRPELDCGPGELRGVRHPASPTPSTADDGGDIETVAAALSGTTYTDDSSDVMTATRYTYRVAAVVAGGEVVRSAPVSVTAGEANQPPVATGMCSRTRRCCWGRTRWTVRRRRSVPGSRRRYAYLHRRFVREPSVAAR